MLRSLTIPLVIINFLFFATSTSFYAIQKVLAWQAVHLFAIFENLLDDPLEEAKGLLEVHL